MKTVNQQEIVLNKFGQIDTDFYLNLARQLRNKAIVGYIKKLGKQIKALFTPATVISFNDKAA
ncbi:MAG: hypothetical protein ACI9IA_000251 [Enterobacterales bacterium]|jgi:DNA-binding FadR family transcriptional regulator